MSLIKERRTQEWREELRKSISTKERMSRNRVDMLRLMVIIELQTMKR